MPPGVFPITSADCSYGPLIMYMTPSYQGMLLQFVPWGKVSLCDLQGLCYPGWALALFIPPCLSFLAEGFPWSLSYLYHHP